MRQLLVKTTKKPNREVQFLPFGYANLTEPTEKRSAKCLVKRVTIPTGGWCWKGHLTWSDHAACFWKTTVSFLGREGVWAPGSWPQDADCKSCYRASFISEHFSISNLRGVKWDIASLSGPGCSPTSAAAIPEVSYIHLMKHWVLGRGLALWRE